jgi:hypothetical protein
MSLAQQEPYHSAPLQVIDEHEIVTFDYLGSEPWMRTSFKKYAQV